MPTISGLLNAYLDANIVLMAVAVAVLWLGFSAALRLAGMAHFVTAQLRLLRVGFVLALLSPVLMAGYGAAVRAGAVEPLAALTLSDIMVSQYLQGRLDVSPSALEAALGLRGQVTTALLSPEGWAGVALAMVGLGAAFFAARFVASLDKLRHVIGASYLWRRFGRLELRLSDTVAVPFSTRTLRRRIVVVPSAMLAAETDLKIALGHELQHLRQRDVDWEIALEALRPLFFWNPAFYLWKRQVETLRELACDRQVLLRRRFDVAAYCQCLIRVCHSSLRRRRLLSLGVPVVGLVRADGRLCGQRAARLLRHRMESLLEGRAEAHPGPVFAALMVPMLGLMGLAMMAIQSPGDWSENRIMLSTIVNLERLAVINGQPSFGDPGF